MRGQVPYYSFHICSIGVNILSGGGKCWLGLAKSGGLFRKIRLFFLFAGDFLLSGWALEVQELEIFTPGTGGLIIWSQQYLPLVQEGQQYGVDSM